MKKGDIAKKIVAILLVAMMVIPMGVTVLMFIFNH